MVVVINGKRKTTVSARLLTASSVYFGLEYSSRNKLTVKVGDEILIDAEECDVVNRFGERWWCLRYNNCYYYITQDDREGSIRMDSDIGGRNSEKCIHRNFSVEFK
jgi:hypothetical protein